LLGHISHNADFCHAAKQKIRARDRGTGHTAVPIGPPI
jgi:hypothetical protein